MKAKIIALAAASFVAPLFAQKAAESKPHVPQEMADGTRSLALKEVEDGRSAAGRSSFAGKGQVEIVSLAEMDAPPSVKANMEEGISKRRGGTLAVASGSIPSTAEVIATVSNTRRSDAELKRRLGYTPADISQTLIGAAELLSTEPNGTIHGTTSTGLSRTYRVPKVGVVILSEDDYLASGTKITLIREMLNTEVNGVPARSYAARSEDGRGRAELRWVTPTRSYFLTLITDDGARIEQGEELLLQIAKGIATLRLAGQEAARTQSLAI